jgi:hypothetical protein
MLLWRAPGQLRSFLIEFITIYVCMTCPYTLSQQSFWILPHPLSVLAKFGFVTPLVTKILYLFLFVLSHVCPAHSNIHVLTNLKYNNKFGTSPFQYTSSLFHLSLFHHALLRLWGRSSVNYYQRREAAWIRHPPKSVTRCFTPLKQRWTFTCRSYWYSMAMR